MTTRVVLGALCAVGACASVSNASIIRYDAALGSLPTDQGFAYTGTIAQPIDTNGVTLMHGPTSSADVSAWQKQFPAGTINFSNSTWSATLNLRLTGSDFGTYSGARRAGYHVFLSDDAGRWIIAELGTNSIGLRNDSVGLNDPAMTIPLNVDFRTVTLEAGPGGARLLVDGQQQLTLAMGTGQTTRNHFLWGDGTIATHVDMAEVHDVTLVPAPGAAAALIGFAGLAMRRRR